MTNRKINIRERTISELICEYAYAVHTDQPELFTYFNPEEVHILGFFTSPTFAEQWARDIFEWAYRNYGDDIPDLYRVDVWKSEGLRLVDECIEWLGERTDFKEEVYKHSIADLLRETG